MKRILNSLTGLAACGIAAIAQTMSPVVIEIAAPNCVNYVIDTADISKYGTVATATTATPRQFGSFTHICDITHVNGQPVTGVLQGQNQSFSLSPVAAPGSGAGIADFAGAGKMATIVASIADANGNTVGDIFLVVAGAGVGGGPAPGLQPGVFGHGMIRGGTGPFIGARGQWGANPALSVLALPFASVTEDTAIRRTRGGTLGKYHLVLQLIPNEYPAVMTTANGLAVFHSDFSPVTALKPATAGETLVVAATGLGTVAGVSIGQQFPADPPRSVSGPVAVILNGKPAAAINAIGWPGTNNTYRVDFQVPAGTKGPSSLQISSSWISGPPVTINIE